MPAVQLEKRKQVMELRKHQQEAVELAVRMAAGQVDSAVVHVCPGGRKSVTIAALHDVLLPERSASASHRAMPFFPAGPGRMAPAHAGASAAESAAEDSAPEPPLPSSSAPPDSVQCEPLPQHMPSTP